MMKTIGLIGGMSWESSLIYYKIINEKVREELGGFHSAKCVMISLDFAEIETLQMKNKWAKAAVLLIDAAKRATAASSECIVICTNTMHKLADEIQEQIDIPLLHIADATAERVKDLHITKIGLLGTRFTMEEDFYRGRLEKKFGLEVLIPDELEREIVHDVIYGELVKGIVREESRNQYREIMNNMVRNGAKGIILGCTEIGLLIKEEDSSVPLFDTTIIHAEKAVEFALS